MFTQKTWDNKKMNNISKYLSYGFTTPEIAEKMGLHRVTIQRHKTELKRRYKRGEGHWVKIPSILHEAMSATLIALGDESQLPESKYVTISLDEFESMKSTIELLLDPKIVQEIKKAKL